MGRIQNRLAGVSDARGRIVSIFLGAVLLPSIALSVLSFNAVPKQREYLKMSLLQQADQFMAHLEESLEATARRRALEAARAVGPERLLEGRPREIRAALRQAGLGDVQFETFRLEAWSSARVGPGIQAAGKGRRGGADLRALSDALDGLGPRIDRDEEDAVPLTTTAGEELGVLRFRFTPEYAHRELVRSFFDEQADEPRRPWVIRVSEPDGSVLYENAPSESRDDFEVRRVMSTPSFAGLRLELRNRDRSIEAEVRRLAIAKTAVIVFIDLMLLAGLVLVFANLRRELHLSRLKSDFVANVSHELKTPLALIRLFAETLELGRVPSQEKARQYHAIINKESRRLTQLINNILDFSRIEAGRKEYSFVRGEVGKVVRDVVDAYRFPIEQQGFALEVDVAEDLPELDLDPEALSQALINLMNNALKYSPETKSIRVSARREADRVLVAVEDRGIGIPKAEQRKIFEKFYRAESSLVHTTKGSGLGLALVRHIMEAHGGSVEVVSLPGEGSTFTLVLPVGSAAAESGAVRRGTMDGGPGRRRPEGRPLGEASTRER